MGIHPDEILFIVTEVSGNLKFLSTPFNVNLNMELFRSEICC